MAVPKRRVSKTRRDKRRSSHWKLTLPGVIKCEHCGAARLSHRVCPECGYYNGRDVVKADAAEKAEA